MISKTEIWQSLPGIPGVEVSMFGNIRTLDRVMSNENGTCFTKGRILKQHNNGKGYLQVCIPVDGKWTMKSVHQIVAQTFIQNPDNLPQVNHRDCNPINNNVDNLEWCTGKYNIEYREKYGKACNHQVYAVNLKTSEDYHFSSQHEASRELRIDVSCINNVIKGRYKYTHGYWFVNADDNATDAIERKLNDIKDVKKWK